MLTREGLRIRRPTPYEVDFMEKELLDGFYDPKVRTEWRRQV